ncbi:MAG: hypothetical protein KatS3mg115_2388 [Candidatus Poribacteria bacterium]|nr:MAG: hypothetical protein KatS3mg115_2388 [Candidatus Poribacteria bacterium]
MRVQPHSERTFLALPPEEDDAALGVHAHPYSYLPVGAQEAQPAPRRLDVQDAADSSARVHQLEPAAGDRVGVKRLRRPLSDRLLRAERRCQQQRRPDPKHRKRRRLSS